MAKKNPKKTSIDSAALAAAADQESTPNQLCKLAAQSPELARIVAANPAIGASVVELLKKRKDPKVNRALASNPGTPMVNLLKLGKRYTSEFVQNPIFDLALAADPRFMAKFPEILLENIITNQQTPENIFLWCVRNAGEFEFAKKENVYKWVVKVAERTDLSEDLASKLAKEAQSSVRYAIAQRTDLSEELTNQLAADSNISVRWAIARRNNLSKYLASKLASDAESDVRVAIARRIDLSKDLASKLAADAKSDVRVAIAGQTDLSEDLASKLAKDAESSVRSAIAKRTDLPEELTNQLAVDAESTVRLAIAERKDLSETFLIKLAGDSNLSVCQAADIKIASWPKLPEKMLRQIAHRCTTDSLRVLSQREDLPEDLFYIFNTEVELDEEEFDEFNDSDDLYGNRAVKNLPDDLILNLIDMVEDNYEYIKQEVEEGWDEESYGQVQNLGALPQWALLCLNLYAGYKFRLEEKVDLPSKVAFEADNVFKALNGHTDLSLETLQTLAKNSDRYVRCAVAQRSDLSLNLIRELSNDTQACVRGAIAQRADIPEDLVVSLAADLSWYVRCAIADRKSLPIILLDELLRDEIEFVSTFARAKLDFNLKSLSCGAIELDIEPIHNEDSDDEEKIVKKSPEEIYYEHPYHRISSRRRIYLSGKTVVIFGLSDEVSAELSARFKAAGAVIANNVSAKTNILVTNQAKTATPGTIRNAIAFGAEVWDEATARAKLTSHPTALGEIHTKSLIDLDSWFNILLSNNHEFLTAFPSALLKCILNCNYVPETIAQWAITNASNFKFANKPEVLEWILERTNLSEALTTKIIEDVNNNERLVNHSNNVVRKMIAVREDLSEELALKLAKDQVEEVLVSLASRKDFSDAVASKLVDSKSYQLLNEILYSKQTNYKIIKLMSQDSRELIRHMVALKLVLGFHSDKIIQPLQEIALELSKDTSEMVQQTIAFHRGLSEEANSYLARNASPIMHHVLKLKQTHSVPVWVGLALAKDYDHLGLLTVVCECMPQEVNAIFANDYSFFVSARNNLSDIDMYELIKNFQTKDRDAIQTLAQHPELPTELVDKLARHDNPRVRSLIALRRDISDQMNEILLNDSNESVRQCIGLKLNLDLSEQAIRDQLFLVQASFRQADIAKRILISKRSDLPMDLLIKLSEDEDEDVRSVIAEQTKLSNDLVTKLAFDTDWSVRFKIAKRADLSQELVRKLAADDGEESWAVRKAIGWRNDLPADVTEQLSVNKNESVRTALTKKDLSWANILTQEPDRNVVKNKDFFKRIKITGLPWRVQDKSTGIEMLLVPPGEFVMGAGKHYGNGCIYTGEPTANFYTVKLTNAFYLGRTQVTQVQWMSVMPENPSQFEGVDNPVDHVLWDDLQIFCRKTGLNLPTEAQWEYACGLGLPPCGASLDELAWYRVNADYKTHPVGQKSPNALGFYDMLGNVWEYCQDFYDENYHLTCMGGITDPLGPTTGKAHVLRGGGYSNSSQYFSSIIKTCRLVPSRQTARGMRLEDVGFRAARTI
jgi:formylglycine-generating enzyme required for sulfatase activity